MEISTQHYGIYTDDLQQSLRFYTEVLEFELLFLAEADEDGIPLKMAWIRNEGGIVIELLQQEGYAAKAAALACRNHIALRTKDMEKTVARLSAHDVEMECLPFDAGLPFDREVIQAHKTFSACDAKGVQLKVAFFRGPFGERFELVQDNIGAVETGGSSSQ